MRKLRFRGIEYLTKSYPANKRQIKDLKPYLSVVIGDILKNSGEPPCSQQVRAGEYSSVDGQIKNSSRLEAMLTT